MCSLGRGSRLRTIVSLRIPSRVSLSLGSPVGRPELFGRRDSDYRSDRRVAGALRARLAERRPWAAGGSQPHQPRTVPPSTTYAYIVCVACPLSIQFVRGAFIPSCRSSARIELGARQSAPATQVSQATDYRGACVARCARYAGRGAVVRGAGLHTHGSLATLPAAEHAVCYGSS